MKIESWEYPVHAENLGGWEYTHIKYWALDEDVPQTAIVMQISESMEMWFRSK